MLTESVPIRGTVSQEDTLASGLTILTPSKTFANIPSATTDGLLLAAVAGKRIRVIAVYFQAGATATTVTFNSKGSGAGVAISSLKAAAANGGAVLPFCPLGWFETNVGEALTATTGAGSAVGFDLVTVAV